MKERTRSAVKVYRDPAHAPATAGPEGVPEIARRLGQLRLAFAANQAEFCRQIDIAQNTWNQYEHARGRPSLDFALRLKRRTGVTLDWIFCGERAGLPHELALRLERAARD